MSDLVRESYEFQITLNFIFDWTENVILHRAIPRQYYTDLLYGICYHPIQSNTTRDAVEFTRRCFHPTEPTSLEDTIVKGLKKDDAFSNFFLLKINFA